MSGTFSIDTIFLITSLILLPLLISFNTLDAIRVEIKPKVPINALLLIPNFLSLSNLLFRSFKYKLIKSIVLSKLKYKLSPFDIINWDVFNLFLVSSSIIVSNSLILVFENKSTKKSFKFSPIKSCSNLSKLILSPDSAFKIKHSLLSPISKAITDPLLSFV